MKTKTRELHVRILRTSGGESRGRFEKYQITHQPGMSVLDAVTRIQNTLDETLAYRYTCRAGLCGTCSMRVNGKNRWTCRTAVAPFLERGLTLEPLPHYPVIRDLVVDMGPFFRHYRRVIPDFTPGKGQSADFAGIANDSHERREINPQIECITCGNCFASCSMVGTNPEYLGPAALNRAFTAIRDSRDRATAERMKVLNSREGVWSCHTQFNCTEACPVDISPTRSIQKLKRLQVRNVFSRSF